MADTAKLPEDAYDQEERARRLKKHENEETIETMPVGETRYVLYFAVLVHDSGDCYLRGEMRTYREPEEVLVHTNLGDRGVKVTTDTMVTKTERGYMVRLGKHKYSPVRDKGFWTKPGFVKLLPVEGFYA